MTRRAPAALNSFRFGLAGLAMLAGALAPAFAQERGRAMTLDDLFSIRQVGAPAFSPDGAALAYAVSDPRDVLNGEKNGPADVHLHVATGPGAHRAYVAGEISVASPAWTPDGEKIAFLAKRDGDKTRALYAIPVDGGEAEKLFSFDTDIADYVFTPDGAAIFFIAAEKQPDTEKNLKEKGFDANVYEESLRFARVWRAPLDGGEAEKLDLEGHASALALSADGARLAVALAPTPTIDDSFMARRIHIVDPARGRATAVVETPGKIGAFEFSPDGAKLAFLAAADRSDPTAGTLAVADAASGDYVLLDRGAEQHVMDFAWAGDDSIRALVHRGTASALVEYGADGQKRGETAHDGFVAYDIEVDPATDRVAYVADSPRHPRELYVGAGLAVPAKWTDHNEWLEGIALAGQRVYRWAARDGVEVEGVLVTPNGRKPRAGWPLIVHVHGGPEAHDSNGWKTSYGGLGQIAAGEGFAVLYPNYRGSTGRGEAFAKLDHKDPPGAEFWDIVDGVGALAEEGLVNRAKVGINGGSYGGFASAWGATIASEHFAAAAPFVALTDLISFTGGTDIPVEMRDVHFMKYPWEDWDLFVEHSPVRHAGKSKTPTLILHGEADPRVHPAQSYELYRFLKLNGSAPVRLVTYPGEGHGNRKAAAQYDYAARVLRWMKHYLKGPGGAPPPYDWGAAEKLGLEE
ncbi:S9 family peptidase [Amphiplicatus metriothermophilus]|uniref:Dipeptidyl aminopeptidase/acylaminoacyl peptidase n=1 Tax=Amphiplicatus metriothermophilus TaxID=1519374 RepID=A0A239PK26_9PROT|nr:S9 family peptidase [Amphiplicatus metriothermophilus]MBB5517503.1 dipeptidyl aminopeptidase/acylaminoacyl peptidase [Amphiplicatus metriothermophilus]SNT68162.1 Dipeptidyl aminopeptidase/acylaminoacyl peptidase [Amphiplicatus metriothermophilus]